VFLWSSLQHVVTQTHCALGMASKWRLFPRFSCSCLVIWCVVHPKHQTKRKWFCITVFVPIIPFMFNLNFQLCSVSVSWRMLSWCSGSSPLNYSVKWQWRRDYYFIVCPNYHYSLRSFCQRSVYEIQNWLVSALPNLLGLKRR